MLEALRHLVLDRPWTAILHDLVDIFIVAFITYRALLVLRGTRAMQMGIAFVLFGGLYVLAKYGEFVTLLNVLSWIATSLILIVVVVFQNDIRRALIRVGAKAWFSSSREQQTKIIDEVVDAATELARHRIGAIITFERDANLLEFVRSDGIAMDALISRELLVSLFLPESLNKTHDGAVLVRNLRIARAGMFFPMPETRIADPNFGSRHRAAIGITEETDAVVVVVSEERGTITLCFGGSFVANIDSTNLRATLLEQLGHRPKEKRRPLMTRMRSGLRRSTKASAEDDPADASGASKPPPSTEPSASTTTDKRKSDSSASLRPPPPSSKSTESSAEPAAAKSSTTAAGAKSSGTASGGKESTESSTLRRASKLMAGSDKAPAVGEVEAGEGTKTPPPSRVSKPMPAAKERRPSSDAIPAAGGESPTTRGSVSKTMNPTELPGSSSTQEEDES